MDAVSQREYDKYGNLIFLMMVKKNHYTSGDGIVYEQVKSQSLNKMIGDVVYTSSGSCSFMDYDDRNMLIKEECMNFQASAKYVDRYIYTYNNDDRLLKKIRTNQVINLHDSYRIPYENPQQKAREEKHEQNINVWEYDHKYDDRGNLLESVTSYYNVPVGTDITGEAVLKRRPSTKDVYENIYNSADQLEKVYLTRYGNIVQDKTEPDLVWDEIESGLVHTLTYDNTEKLICKEENKTLMGYRFSKEGMYNYKCIYKDDELYEEECYSPCGILLVVTRYEMIEGRLCKKLLSPVRGTLRWYLIAAVRNHSAVYSVDEEIVTEQVMTEICEYLASTLTNVSSSLDVEVFNVNARLTDRTTFRDDLNKVCAKYRSRYGFRFTASDDYNS